MKYKIGDIIEDEYSIDQIIGHTKVKYKIEVLKMKVNQTSVAFNVGSKMERHIGLVENTSKIAYRYIWTKELEELINE